MTKVATYLRHNLDTLLLQQVIKLPRRIVEASMVAAESENRSKFRQQRIDKPAQRMHLRLAINLSQRRCQPTGRIGA